MTAFIVISIIFLLVHLQINLGESGSNGQFHKFPGRFDPEGQLIHLEYAKKAVQKYGGSILAIKGIDGIILASSLKRRNQSKLILQSFSQKISVLHDGLVMGTSGLALHSISITELAKSICRGYYEKYLLPIPIEKLSHELASTIHQQSLGTTTIPLGIKVILAGYDSTHSERDQRSYKIYTIEPDGSYYSWNAVAIGLDEEKMNEELFTLLQETNSKKDNDGQTNPSNPLISIGKSSELLTILPQFLRIIDKKDDDEKPSSSSNQNKDFEVSQLSFHRLHSLTCIYNSSHCL